MTAANLMEYTDAVAPEIILWDRWRASRLPSVPSALRGLDPRRPLPFRRHLSERRRGLSTSAIVVVRVLASFDHDYAEELVLIRRY